MSGFIKIPKDIVDTWLAEKPSRLLCWFRMCSVTAYEPTTVRIGNKVLPVAKNQIVRGITRLENIVGLSNRALHIFLDNLVGEGFITYVSKTEPRRLEINMIYGFSDSAKPRRKLEKPQQKCQQKSQTLIEDIEGVEIKNNNISILSRENDLIFFEPIKG